MRSPRDLKRFKFPFTLCCALVLVIKPPVFTILVDPTRSIGCASSHRTSG